MDEYYSEQVKQNKKSEHYKNQRKSPDGKLINLSEGAKTSSGKEIAHSEQWPCYGSDGWEAVIQYSAGAGTTRLPPKQLDRLTDCPVVDSSEASFSG